MSNKKVFLAGHNGLVGSSILKKLKEKGYKKIITKSRKQLNLLDYNKVLNFIKKTKPHYIIIAAAKVGGIYSNYKYQAEFIHQNISIQINIIHAAYLAGVKNLIFLGSSCVYPKFCKQPIKEEYLLSGKLENTNEAYAIAKISGIKLAEAMYKQFGFKVICLMPTNLYGGKDNFDEFNSHVIPGIFTKILKAIKNKKKKVKLWGSGKPKREFLFVDDLANAIFHILKLHDKKLLNISKGFPIFNVGSGEEISIKDLSNKIKKICKFDGKIFFDKNFPDGTYRKNLDSTKIKKTGWKPIIKLNQGLNKVLKNYKYKNK